MSAVLYGVQNYRHLSLACEHNSASSSDKGAIRPCDADGGFGRVGCDDHALDGCILKGGKTVRGAAQLWGHCGRLAGSQPTSSGELQLGNRSQGSSGALCSSLWEPTSIWC